jgi:methionyl-tRNA synthetase
MPAGTPDPVFWETAHKFENAIAEKLERAELRDAFHTIFELSSYANKYFQDAEPWRLRKDDPPKAGANIRDLAFIVRDIAVLIEPYLPQSAAKLASFFGLELGPSLNWGNIGRPEGIDAGAAIKSEVLFAKLEDVTVDSLRERYSGSQKDRQNETTAESKPVPAFENTLDLRVAKIEKVERHPKADKLYVIGLETGEGLSGVREERTIVSGLVGFYTEEQLLGKRIIVAYNLKPAKLRGIESRGMLLAAGDKGGIGADGSPSEEGAPSSEGEPAERCEVLDAGDVPTGTRLLPEGAQASAAPAEIDIDTFFSFPIMAKDFAVQFDGKNLCLNGKPVRTGIVSEGEVH